MTDSNLAHFGVKGMKWGVRKQPTLHPASEDSAKATAHRVQAKTKGIHTLSNKDLQEYINRANLEQQFNRLSTQQKSKNAGVKWVTNVLSEVGKQQAKNLLVSKTTEFGSAIFKMAKGVNLG